MTRETDLTRRSVILIGGTGTALALAACSGPATSSNTDATEKPSTGSSVSGTPEELAKLADIPVGGCISATLNGNPILISQPSDGAVVAFSAICTHQGCVVKPAKDEFDCPCHGSRYNFETGAVLDGPAPKPLPKVEVAVAGAAVVAG